MSFSTLKSIAYTIGVASLLAAPNTYAIGLVDAFQAALSNDARYQAAVYRNQAGQQYAAIGQSHIRPTLTASYSFNRINSDIDTVSNGQPVNLTRNYNSDNAVLQMRQPIINAESWAMYRIGGLQTDLSDVELKQNKQALIQRFIGAYIEANYSQDLLLLAKKERASYQDQEKANQAMFARGEGTKTEVFESRAKLSVSEATLIESENELEIKLESLSNIVGHKVLSIQQFNEDFSNITLSPATFDEWKAIGIAHNPDIQSTMGDIEIAKQELKKAKAGHLPTLDAVASVSQSSSDTVATFNQDIFNKAIGLQLNIPIYAGGGVSATVLQNEAKVKEAEATLAAEKKDMLLELRKAYNSLKTKAFKIDALKSSIASAELLITATKKSLSAGFRTNQDILDAQKQLFETKRNLTLARYQYVMAYINLKKAAGTLNENDVSYIASFYH